MVFEYYNNNPKNKKTQDCVIRAITTALETDWHNISEDLYYESIKIGSSQTSTETYTKYLDGYGYEKIPVKYNTPSGKKRYTAGDVCKWDGTYIIALAGHLTVVKDHKLLDLFDCSNKCAYKIWNISLKKDLVD